MFNFPLFGYPYNYRYYKPYNNYNPYITQKSQKEQQYKTSSPKSRNRLTKQKR